MKQLFAVKSLDRLVSDTEEPTHQLKRTLGPVQLTALGIGAIIGAGIFSSVGSAAAGGAEHLGAGPAVALSFVLTAVACGFAALCYMEFAAMVPVSGSAYTYAYATLGELIAWIIGWDLILEYAIGNVAVAVSWSGYFQELLRGLGVHWPEWLGTDFRTAAQGARDWPRRWPRAGTSTALSAVVRQAADAFNTAPHLAGIPIIVDLPAFLIVAFITWVLVRGISESAWLNSAMVALKLVIIAFFIIVGAFYVKPENWTPFAPNGFRGISSAAAIIFFAYIGFDAVSTAAEETKNPQRDMPIAMMASLVICTVIYILVARRADRARSSGTSWARPSRWPRPSRRWACTGPPGIISLGRGVRDDVGAGRLPARPAAHLLLDGARRPAAAVGREGAPEVPDAARDDDPHRRRRRDLRHASSTSTRSSSSRTSARCSPSCWWPSASSSCGGRIRIGTARSGRRWCRCVPALAVVMCTYLMLQLPWVTWVRFVVWLAVGLLLYFVYGVRHSVLRRANNQGA